MTRNEFISGIIIILLGIFVVFYSIIELNLGSFATPGPGMFPFISGLGMVVLTLLWVVPNLKRIVNAGSLWGKSEWRNPLILVLLTAAYAFLLEPAGYIVSTLLFIVGWQIVIERQSLEKSILIAGICTAGLYFLFVTLLRVHLPMGILEF